jgi:hypothetical protein
MREKKTEKVADLIYRYRNILGYFSILAPGSKGKFISALRDEGVYRE